MRLPSDVWWAETGQSRQQGVARSSRPKPERPEFEQRSALNYTKSKTCDVFGLTIGVLHDTIGLIHITSAESCSHVLRRGVRLHTRRLTHHSKPTATALGISGGSPSMITASIFSTGGANSSASLRGKPAGLLYQTQREPRSNRRAACRISTQPCASSTGGFDAGYVRCRPTPPTTSQS